MLAVTLTGETKDVPLGQRAVNRTGPLGQRRTARVRRALAQFLTRSGFNAQQVAEVLNVDHSTACRWIKAAGEAEEDPDPVPIGLGGVTFVPSQVHFASWNTCQGCGGSIKPGSGQVCLICHRSDETISGFSPKPVFAVKPLPKFELPPFHEIELLDGTIGYSSGTALTMKDRAGIVLDALDDLDALKAVIQVGLAPPFFKLPAKSRSKIRRALKQRRHRRAQALLVEFGWLDPEDDRRSRSERPMSRSNSVSDDDTPIVIVRTRQ